MPSFSKNIFAEAYHMYTGAHTHGITVSCDHVLPLTRRWIQPHLTGGDSEARGAGVDPGLRPEKGSSALSGEGLPHPEEMLRFQTTHSGPAWPGAQCVCA